MKPPHHLRLSLVASLALVHPSCSPPAAAPPAANAVRINFDLSGWPDKPPSTRLRFLSMTNGYPEQTAVLPYAKGHGAALWHFDIPKGLMGETWVEVMFGEAQTYTRGRLFEIKLNALAQSETQEVTIPIFDELRGYLLCDNSSEACETGMGDEEVLRFWGDRADNAWAVGKEGLILRWDRERWMVSRAKADHHRTLNAIYGDIQGHVWAAGDQGTVLSWDGAVWASCDIKDRRGQLITVNLLGVHVDQNNRPWFVGSQGTVLRPNSGATTCAQPTPLQTGMADLTAVWGTPQGEVFTVDREGVLYEISGPTGSREVGRLPFSGEILSAWAGEDEVWLAGRNGNVFHKRSGAWQQVETGTKADFHSVRGNSAADVWIVGDGGKVLHWNGERLSESDLPRPERLRLVLPENKPASGPSVLTQDGRLLVKDGVNWLEPLTPSSRDEWCASELSDDLRAIAGADEQHLWVLGADGTVFRRVGSTWCTQQTNSSCAERAVHGMASRSQKDAWVVGSAGLVRRWDRGRWAELRSAGTADLEAVWATANGEIWTSGRETYGQKFGPNQVLLHLENGAWSQLPLNIPEGYPLRGEGTRHVIAGSSASDVWGTTEPGLLWHWNGNELKVRTGYLDDLNIQAMASLGEQQLVAVGQYGVKYCPPAVSACERLWKSAILTWAPGGSGFVPTRDGYLPPEVVMQAPLLRAV